MYSLLDLIVNKNISLRKFSHFHSSICSARVEISVNETDLKNSLELRFSG